RRGGGPGERGQPGRGHPQPALRPGGPGRGRGAGRPRPLPLRGADRGAPPAGGAARPPAPPRWVVLIAEPPEGRQGVRSWPRVVNRRPNQGPEVVWEEVVVQTNVHPRPLTAVVLPLLLPELPVFTWWQGTPPFDQEVFTELTSVTDRLIVDSAAFADPGGAPGGRGGGGGTVEPAVTDCAWGRLTDWRQLLSAPFGGPQLRPALARGPRVRGGA